MPDYRRAVLPGGTYFFTLVTYRRAPILCDPLARRLLRESVDACVRATAFTVDAMVLLPDHLHAMLTLPPGDADFSSRWSRIKRSFTQRWLAASGWEGAVSFSQGKDRRRGVWQRQFWEHAIRDRRDYNAHLDYICYNPVRHGLAACPHEWPWSSFHRLVDRGVYERTWCCGCDQRCVTPPKFGALREAAIETSFGE
jgi:putative transposase